MENQKELQEKVLLDTLEYYIQDTSNRRCTGDGKKNLGCYYSPKNAGKTKKESQGCAIGRLISDYHKNKFDNISGSTAIEDIIFHNKEYNIKIPKILLNLGSNFCKDLQKLHDNLFNWSVNGLSGTGREAVNNIIKYYKLEKSKFKKFL